MIMHVVESASRARLVSRVIVATDDERIFEAVPSARRRSANDFACTHVGDRSSRGSGGHS